MNISEIRARLSSLGDKERAVNSKRYLKSDYDFYGLRVPELRKVAKEIKLDFNSSLKLFDQLWNSGNHEEMSLALFLINRYKKSPEVWDFLVSRLAKAKSWDHIDELSSHTLGEILAENLSLIPEIKKLFSSKNPWFRRTSIVSTYPLIKKNKLELTFLLAERLAYDEDIYVQKAAGWMLREAGKKDRLATRNFIMSHLNMKAAAFSYATEKMIELRGIKKEKEKNE
ncbi:MAG: DNA alkylation repair protein [Candidatus Pacearchaeota archaeon]|nr:DNA alkylation repair protein [Candidatus Pacearchaeota archaeon]